MFCARLSETVISSDPASKRYLVGCFLWAQTDDKIMLRDKREKYEVVVLYPVLIQGVMHNAGLIGTNRKFKATVS